MAVFSHMTIHMREVAALFERAKLYRQEALSVHKPGSSIVEDSPIKVLSTHETEAICHGYFCHIKRATLLYMRARCL
jgi:hypothetical protein